MKLSTGSYALAMAAAITLLGTAVQGETSPAAADPAMPKLEFAFEEVVTLADGLHVGGTAYGDRSIVPITGGTFSGPRIKGSVMPGGWDWQLMRKDGCVNIEANYMLKTDDGAVINIINKGVTCPSKDGRPVPTFTTPVFEAPVGKHDWLNRSTFVGVLLPVTGKPAVRIRFYTVK